MYLLTHIIFQRFLFHDAHRLGVLSRTAACLGMSRRTDAKHHGVIRRAAANWRGFDGRLGIDSMLHSAAEHEICLFRVGCTVHMQYGIYSLLIILFIVLYKK